MPIEAGTPACASPSRTSGPCSNFSLPLRLAAAAEAGGLTIPGRHLVAPGLQTVGELLEEVARKYPLAGGADRSRVRLSLDGFTLPAAESIALLNAGDCVDVELAAAAGGSPPPDVEHEPVPRDPRAMPGPSGKHEPAPRAPPQPVAKSRSPSRSARRKAAKRRLKRILGAQQRAKADGEPLLAAPPGLAEPPAAEEAAAEAEPAAEEAATEPARGRGEAEEEERATPRNRREPRAVQLGSPFTGHHVRFDDNAEPLPVARQRVGGLVQLFEAKGAPEPAPKRGAAAAEPDPAPTRVAKSPKLKRKFGGEGEIKKFGDMAPDGPAAAEEGEQFRVETYTVEPVVDYAAKPPLKGKPATGDAVAYRLLEIGEDWTPQYRCAGRAAAAGDSPGLTCCVALFAAPTGRVWSPRTSWPRTGSPSGRGRAGCRSGSTCSRGPRGGRRGRRTRSPPSSCTPRTARSRWSSPGSQTCGC